LALASSRAASAGRAAKTAPGCVAWQDGSSGPGKVAQSVSADAVPAPIAFVAANIDLLATGLRSVSGVSAI